LAARSAVEGRKDTRRCRKFNRLVCARKGLYAGLIPLRDGVTICRKL